MSDYFNPAAHTWFVAERGAYYSTATRAWSTKGPELATRIGTVAELIEVMERAGFPDHAPLNANHVRRECARRMMMLVGARDTADLSVKLSNALRETCRLQDIVLQGGEWTTEQAQRAAQLRAADLAIERFRARSNVMEASPPADYRDDARWA